MASPLTLLMPLNPGTNPLELAGALKEMQHQIDDALTGIKTVHYARFVLLDRSTPNLQPGGTSTDQLVLAVITEYDGSFEQYIGDFVAKIGDVFNALLAFVVGGQALIRVQDHPDEFLAFVKANDASQQPAPPPQDPSDDSRMFQAYTATVQEILASL